MEISQKRPSASISNTSQTKGKLVLINDFYEKIGYPHKEYNKIEDEEDDYYSEEDMKWDRLHKHGL